MTFIAVMPEPIRLQRVTFAFLAMFLLLAILVDFLPGQNSISYDRAVVTLIHDVSVAAEEPGIVSELLVQPGDRIADGDVIAQLRQRLREAEWEAARAERKTAELQASNDVNYRYAIKSSEVNDKVLQRSRNARRMYSDSISRTEIERLELSLQQSELSAEQAKLEQEISLSTLDLRRSQEKVAQILLDNRTIASPLTGIAARVFVQPGQWINAGQPIARIISLERLRVKSVFPKQYIHQLTRDDQAHFAWSIDDQERSLAASIVFISPEIDTANQDFEVWADIDNSDALLLPGIRGELKIELGE